MLCNLKQMFNDSTYLIINKDLSIMHPPFIFSWIILCIFNQHYFTVVSHYVIQVIRKKPLQIMAEYKMLAISFEIDRQKLSDRLKANMKISIRILTVAEHGKVIGAYRFYI